MKIRLLGHDFFYAFTVLRVHKSIIKLTESRDIVRQAILLGQNNHFNETLLMKKYRLITLGFPRKTASDSFGL